MSKRRPNRIRRSESEWTDILRDFAASSDSARQFCETRGLALASFQRWRRQIGNVSPASEAKFVELSSPTANAATDGWSLEIALPNGVSLRFQG